MRQISYLLRKGARYPFRRRLHFSSAETNHISISLGTADPMVARRLARRLAVRWDEVNEMDEEIPDRRTLTCRPCVSGYKIVPPQNIGQKLTYGQKRAELDGHGMSFNEVVSFLGITHLLGRWPKSPSRGEAQRVAIGRALLSNPNFS